MAENDSGENISSSRSQMSSTKFINGVEQKPKKFQNGWTKEQERLMADWSDIASCYRWLHDQSNKIYHIKTLLVNIPVIILSTLGGTANFAAQSLFENDETSKKFASFAIGGISIFAGMLTTIGNYLRYAQLEESHRVASITWGKFQRLLAVELALNPNDRMDSLDFLKICRAELDRLIEQSPPIPKDLIIIFEKKFGTIKDLKRPDVCGALEHTSVFQSSETRLKQMAVEASLMLRRKRQTLNELVSPQIQQTINEQVEARIAEAIEERKNKLEEEIENNRQVVQKTKDEFQKALDERKIKIQEEIDLEKKKILQDITNQEVVTTTKMTSSNFENRINYNKSNICHNSLQNIKNTNIIPEKQIISKMDGVNIVIISKE